MIFRGINVVFVYVTDMAAARDFYENLAGFGMPVVDTAEWVEFDLGGGAHFALHPTHPDAVRGVDRAGQTIKFSIEVNDLDGVYEAMKGRGVDFLRPPEHGTGLRLAEFVDPEGHTIRLIEFERSI